MVDDGSDDGTFDVVRETVGGWALAVRVFSYRPNRGKGCAIKFGVAHAHGERILFTDADLSTPIEEAGRLLARLDADVAIGSRKMPGARILVHQPRFREWLGKGFTRLVRGLIADVTDVTCGFKAFRRPAGKDIFERVRIDDWSFDAEVLWLARALGYRLAEVPVRWEDRPETKVRLARDLVRALCGVARIRAYAARGLYRTAAGLGAAGAAWESAPAPKGAASRPAR